MAWPDDQIKGGKIAAWPACMAPDGGACCPQYDAALKEMFKFRDALVSARAILEPIGHHDSLINDVMRVLNKALKK